MAATFAWLIVIVDSVTAIVFLRIGHVTAYRALTITGAALMGATVFMLSAILFDNSDLASWGYVLGGVACFIGLWLIARPSKR